MSVQETVTDVTSASANAIVTDVAIAAGGISAWWWMPHFDHTIHVLLATGGVILLYLRIAAVIKEYRNKG